MIFLTAKFFSLQYIGLGIKRRIWHQIISHIIFRKQTTNQKSLFHFFVHCMFLEKVRVSSEF